MYHYDLGNRIYELRKAKNLSQKELGNLIGVSNKAVSKWENGTTIPKTDTLVKLSQVLEVSPQELLQGKTDNRLTLGQLSSKTNEIFLKEEIEKRNKALRQSKLDFQKRYLTILLSVFFSSFITIAVFSQSDFAYDTSTKWYLVLFDCIIFAYVLSSIVTGFVFCINTAKNFRCGQYRFYVFSSPLHYLPLRL